MRPLLQIFQLRRARVDSLRHRGNSELAISFQPEIVTTQVRGE